MLTFQNNLSYHILKNSTVVVWDLLFENESWKLLYIKSDGTSVRIDFFEIYLFLSMS